MRPTSTATLPTPTPSSTSARTISHASLRSLIYRRVTIVPPVHAWLAQLREEGVPFDLRISEVDQSCKVASRECVLRPAQPTRLFPATSPTPAARRLRGPPRGSGSPARGGSFRLGR